MPWSYLLRCADGTLYGGAAKDLAARLAQHESGRASRYTRSRLPVTLAWAREVPTWSDALREEIRVKALPRTAKETLVSEGSARLTRLGPKSYRDMPWKNGRGVTTEIARHPSGDGPFDWRISTAMVSEHGPFSAFPGMDRILVVLEGDGLELTHEGVATRLEPLVAHAFSGDVATVGGAVDGPVRDFNVIWRRDRVRAHVDVLRKSATIATAPTTLLYVVSGTTTVVVPGGVKSLAARESLLLEATTAVVRPTEGAIVIAVALFQNDGESGA